MFRDILKHPLPFQSPQLVLAGMCTNTNYLRPIYLQFNTTTHWWHFVHMWSCGSIRGDEFGFHPRMNQTNPPMLGLMLWAKCGNITSWLLLLFWVKEMDWMSNSKHLLEVLISFIVCLCTYSYLLCVIAWSVLTWKTWANIQSTLSPAFWVTHTIILLYLQVDQDAIALVLWFGVCKLVIVYQYTQICIWIPDDDLVLDKFLLQGSDTNHFHCLLW